MGKLSSPAIDLHVFSVIIAYCLSSLGGVFVNKACLSAYDFRFTITLMLAQLVVSVSALSVLRAFRVVSIPRRSWRELYVLIFPAIFLISNVTVGLLALRLVNIPMFSAFRRLSVLNVMVLEYLVLGRTASKRIMYTVVVMVCGSFLAGLGDLTFDPVGYFLVFLNNFITAANLVSIKKASAVVRLDALSLNYYVSCIALPIVLVLAIVSGELSGAIADVNARSDLQTVGFAVALSFSAGSAFLVNFFTNLCTQLTSPLTTAISGQMKNILQTVLGVFAWGYVVSALNLAGLTVALAGSLCFAYIKFRDARDAASSNAIPAAADGKADSVDVSLLSPRTSDSATNGAPLSDDIIIPLSSGMGDSSANLASTGDRIFATSRQKTVPK
jgi:Triose-phosphate Transporter family